MIKTMNFLDVIFPKKCINCGKGGSYVCDKCQVGLWEEEQICPGCRRASQYGLRHTFCRHKSALEGLTCLWAYEGVARKLITKGKYGRYYFDYLRELTSLSVDQLDSRVELSYLLNFLKLKPTIVPVPLWPEKERKRGFNQAEIIGKEFAARHKLTSGHLLIRVKDTQQQVGRSREERLKAMDGAFQFKIYNLKFKIPEAVLLVDDVWTTGATMNECAKTLKKAGVESVWGLVLAR